MVTIRLTKKQQENLFELMERGYAYMDEHGYRDCKKMEKLKDVVLKDIYEKTGK